jgi:Fe2+ or Zn2+ uptake regulation protein
LGLKAPPQRLAVCGYLEGNPAHPSVEEIYLHLKYHYPTITIVTGYSTLEALAKMGEIYKIDIDT